MPRSADNRDTYVFSDEMLRQAQETPTHIRYVSRLLRADAMMEVHEIEEAKSYDDDEEPSWERAKSRKQAIQQQRATRFPFVQRSSGYDDDVAF